MSGPTYKGAVVEKVVHHKTKREGVLRLDKGRMTFFARAVDADPLSAVFADKDGAKVRSWLTAELARTAEGDRLEWLPVVEVKVGGDRHYRGDDENGQSLDLTFERYHVALTKDQREWRKLPWAACQEKSTGCVPPNDRYAESAWYALGSKATEEERRMRWGRKKAFRLPSYAERGNGEGEAVLPYSEGLWTALKSVEAQLTAARKTLGAMIGDKDGVAFLAEIGAGTKTLLLTAGSPAKGD